MLAGAWVNQFADDKNPSSVFIELVVHFLQMNIVLCKNMLIESLIIGHSVDQSQSFPQFQNISLNSFE